jgi:hypothetical protein
MTMTRRTLLGPGVLLLLLPLGSAKAGRRRLFGYGFLGGGF